MQTFWSILNSHHFDIGNKYFVMKSLEQADIHTSSTFGSGAFSVYDAMFTYKTEVALTERLSVIPMGLYLNMVRTIPLRNS